MAYEIRRINLVYSHRGFEISRLDGLKPRTISAHISGISEGNASMFYFGPEDLGIPARIPLRITGSEEEIIERIRHHAEYIADFLNS
jgi:hypothetical protein